jgi:hypothetical protein
VASKIRLVERDDHQVGQARDDVLVAARAQVLLGGLIGMDPADLYLGIRAHRTRASVTTKAAATST